MAGPTAAGVLPTRDDPFVASAAGFVGGPPGAHAERARRVFTPLRVMLLLTSATVLAGWLQKSPCRGNDRSATAACSTDVLSDYRGESPEVFFAAATALLGLSALLTVWAVVLLRRRRPWDGALVAVAPLLAVAAATSWSFLAVSFSVLALLAWSRRRLTFAGLLLGVALTLSWSAVSVLGGLWLLSKRKQQPQAWKHVGLTTAVAWVALNVPWALFDASAWWGSRVEVLVGPAGTGTVWDIAARWPIGGAAGITGFRDVADNSLLVTAISVGLLILGCVLLSALVARAPRSPRLAVVIFLLAAMFALVGTAWPTWYSLVLVPFAALARPSWRAFIAWQVVEVCYFIAHVLLLRYESTGRIATIHGVESVPPVIFVIVAIARWAALAALCFLMVREILRPKRDRVRNGPNAQDDPDGGVFNDPRVNQEHRGRSWREVLLN